MDEILEILLKKAKEKSTTSKKEEEAEKEDDRDINQLLEFIQGDDRKVLYKKKKRRKKRKIREGASLAADVEVQEADVEVQEAKALEAKLKKNYSKNICHEGIKSDTEGGYKKKVKGRQRKADEEMQAFH